MAVATARILAGEGGCMAEELTEVTPTIVEAIGEVELAKRGPSFASRWSIGGTTSGSVSMCASS
jgi:hypothetical protein